MDCKIILNLHLFFNTIVIVLLVALCSSCSIEKRLYNKGWDVQWNKKYWSTDANEDKKLAFTTHPVNTNDPVDTFDLVKQYQASDQLLEINPTIKCTEKEETFQLREYYSLKKQLDTNPVSVATPVIKIKEMKTVQNNYVDRRWVGFFTLSMVSLLTGILLLVFLDPAAMLAYQLFAIYGGGILILLGVIFLIVSFVLLGIKTSKN